MITIQLNQSARKQCRVFRLVCNCEITILIEKYFQFKQLPNTV